MRIAYISYEYPVDTPSGGIATYVGQAARMMADLGHDVEVFAASPHRNMTFSSNGIVEHLIATETTEAFAQSVAIPFVLRHCENPFDVIEGPDYLADAHVIASLFPQLPLVVKMHTPSVLASQLNKGDTILGSLRFSGMKSAMVRSSRPGRLGSGLYACLRRRDNRNALYKREWEHALASNIVAPPCVDLCNFAIRYWGLNEEAVHLAPHPYVPSTKFLEIPAPVNAKVVGYVGRLERRKGVEVFAEAIPAILASDPDVTIKFVGTALTHATGVRYDEWLKMALGPLANRVELVGRVPLDEMHKVYATLDVCVFPSLWENFPNVCLEAMAAARPIVATDGGGMKEMLENGRCGKIVSSGSSSSLAQAVIGLLKNPREGSFLGSLARQRVLEHYNKNVIGKMMERVYLAAVKRAAERARLSSQ